MGLGQIEVELQGCFGSDRAIAESAWTSSYSRSKKEKKSETEVERLVRRLAREGHSVPFESVVFRFWFRWPIFVDRQHMTHRIASHSGLSGRYRTLPEDFYTTPTEVDLILSRANISPSRYHTRINQCVEEYREYLGELKVAKKSRIITPEEYKRAREVLRGMVPTASMVERTTIMNLRSFANYQKLRNSDHAQPEIRCAAEKMLEQVKAAKVCPVAIEELEILKWRI